MLALTDTLTVFGIKSMFNKTKKKKEKKHLESHVKDKI